MYTKGLFIAALAAFTANAATVRQMTSEPTTYAQTQTADGSGTTVVSSSCDDGSSSCDDDSYCFRNTGCISTRWDQQIQETHNPLWMIDDFSAHVGSFRCPECSCSGDSGPCANAMITLIDLAAHQIVKSAVDPNIRT